MNWSGVIVGVVTIASIMAYHPLVIRTEYRWGSRAKWLFIALGTLALIALVVVHWLMQPTDVRIVAEICLSVFAFASFWSAHEVKLQRQRVLKGRFPDNPDRKW